MWVIGPELGEFIAGLRNEDPAVCVHETRQSWLYASRAARWKSDDDTLEVICVDDSKKLTKVLIKMYGIISLLV